MLSWIMPDKFVEDEQLGGSCTAGRLRLHSSSKALELQKCKGSYNAMECWRPSGTHMCTFIAEKACGSSPWGGKDR